MKILIAAIAAATTMAAVASAPAADAQPFRHHGYGRHHARPHRVCFPTRHGRVCRFR